MAERAAGSVACNMAAEEHVLPLRVYYEDTDTTGAVYHANYLRYAERARTEMLRSLDTDHIGLLAEHGIHFVVRRCCADFRRPARLDDRLEVRTRVAEIRRASMRVEQVVRRDGEDLVRLEVRLACVSRDGRPARVPPRLREKFTRLCQNQAARPTSGRDRPAPSQKRS